MIIQKHCAWVLPGLLPESKPVTHRATHILLVFWGINPPALWVSAFKRSVAAVKHWDASLQRAEGGCASKTAAAHSWVRTATTTAIPRTRKLRFQMDNMMIFHYIFSKKKTLTEHIIHPKCKSMQPIPLCRFKVCVLLIQLRGHAMTYQSSIGHTWYENIIVHQTCTLECSEMHTSLQSLPPAFIWLEVIVMKSVVWPPLKLQKWFVS